MRGAMKLKPPLEDAVPLCSPLVSPTPRRDSENRGSHPEPARGDGASSTCCCCCCGCCACESECCACAFEFAFEFEFEYAGSPQPSPFLSLPPSPADPPTSCCAARRAARDAALTNGGCRAEPGLPRALASLLVVDEHGLPGVAHAASASANSSSANCSPANRSSASCAANRPPASCAADRSSASCALSPYREPFSRRLPFVPLPLAAPEPGADWDVCADWAVLDACRFWGESGVGRDVLGASMRGVTRALPLTATGTLDAASSQKGLAEAACGA